MVETALVDWSRLQFALTAGYHWLFVPLTLGLAVIMATMETIYVVTGDEFWKKTTKFWMKLFAINFAVGIATGIILEFEFGTNWSNYSWFVGDIFGAPLAIEGIFAFFIEATFFAVMFFGWGKVSKRFHLASTWLTGIGAAISAVWILVANSWMQNPVGMEFNPDTVRHEMVDFWALVLNPIAVSKFFHSVFSGWMTGSIFVIGISSWYLLKKRETRFALASIRVAAIVGVVGTLAVMFSGDSSGVQMAKYQPMKLAAAEGLEEGGTRAPFSIVPGVEVPGALSILATHDIDGLTVTLHPMAWCTHLPRRRLSVVRWLFRHLATTVHCAKVILRQQLRLARCSTRISSILATDISTLKRSLFPLCHLFIGHSELWLVLVASCCCLWLLSFGQSVAVVFSTCVGCCGWRCSLFPWYILLVRRVGLSQRLVVSHGLLMVCFLLRRLFQALVLQLCRLPSGFLLPSSPSSSLLRCAYL